MRAVYCSPLHYQLIDSTDLYRFLTKVTLHPQSTKQRLIRTKFIELYSTSMYCLWIYDYFITLGDEVGFYAPFIGALSGD